VASRAEVIAQIGIFQANRTQESVQFVVADISALSSQLKST
jgi:hypothetical protein